MNKKTNATVGTLFKMFISGLRNVYRLSLWPAKTPIKIDKTNAIKNPITILKSVFPKYWYVDFFPSNVIIEENASIGEGKIIEFLSKAKDKTSHNSRIKIIPKMNNIFLFVKKEIIWVKQLL